MFDALYLMTTAIKGSVNTLMWAMAVLLLVQVMIALFLNQVLFDTYFEDSSRPDHEKQEVYEYFGTFTRALLSMFEMTMANWPPVCRLLSERVNEWFMLFSVLHKLTIGFAVIGVINGVFMQETFALAAKDDLIMMRQKEKSFKSHTAKMTLLFSHFDTSGDGFLDREELRKIASDKSVKLWLESMELSISDVDTLWSLIDDEQEGQVPVDKLISGIGKLKGSARSIDVVTMMHELRTLRNDIEGVLRLPARKQVTTPLTESSLAEHCHVEHGGRAATP